MGQFKPMVKMMTTEPTVELKLKKGGKVEKKMQMGGALAPTATPAPAAMPASMPASGGAMPGKAPMRPSLAARRRMMRAMPAGAAPAAPVGSAAQVMKKGGETKAEHAKEMKTAKELKEHKSMPASKAHKGLKTGGVVKGQGGYATGGVVNGQGGYKKGGMATGGVKMGNAGGYKDGGMTMVEKGGKMVPDFAADGKGKMKMGGKACATGGVTMGNGGGYKKGGAAKKYAEGGAVNDSGKAEAMPQGRKKPSTSVSITELSGTFKKGGAVMTPAEKRLTKMFDKENAPAMKAAKSKDVEIYDKYGKAMRRGGKC